ncbi:MULTISPECIES: hypothetical protein [Vibrio]|nr:MULTISPECIES: hypothetical protein [Vibrio]BAU70988.1 hypothetical protein [Vibrio sp. 04Ya108]BBM67751.1 hypothetical protein VA249_43970 [Vibrio alfacsensis]BCN26922.1 hypothetical protein VYA_41140 [Vibrio alfacsensis]
MARTPLEIALCNVLIDLDETLTDMEEKLGISVALLSAIELGTSHFE